MNSVSYKLKNIFGKGLGMVATKDILQGELILEEKPSLDSSLKMSLQKQFQNLSANEQNGIKSLKNLYAADQELIKIYNLARVCNVDLIGIINTNGFERKDPNGSILCLRFSRFNHSCMPNVAWTFDNVYNRAVALSYIAKDEELCISYSLLTDTIAQVRSELFLKYKFHCMCDLCDSKNYTKRNMIENNRVLYGRLQHKVYHTQINDPCKHLKLVKKLFKAMELGNIMIPENIERDAYQGFTLALLCKNRSEAQKYIKQAYEANRITEGENAEWTIKLLEYVNNPEGHELFKGW